MKRTGAFVGALALLLSGYVVACGTGEPALEPGETGRAETMCVNPVEALTVETVETVDGEVMTATIIKGVRPSAACAGVIETLKEPTTTYFETSEVEEK